MVQRQLQHRLLITQLFGPVGQLPRLLTGLHPVALPHGKVRVLDRQGRQLRHLALAVNGIQLHQFVDHHRHRPAVGDDMVQGQHQYMLVRRQTQQPGPQQRPLLQVERLPCFGFDPGPHSGLVGVCLLLDGQLERHLIMNDLHCLLAIQAESGAQSFVTLDQGAEGLLQGVDIQRPGQLQCGRNVVSGAVRCPLPQEPLPLLGVGKR
ncbi:hypothetical protein D3C78_870240 [compost metagenome]